MRESLSHSECSRTNGIKIGTGQAAPSASTLNPVLGSTRFPRCPLATLRDYEVATSTLL